MPSRVAVGLEEVASLDNLSLAFWRAASGKRDRVEVRVFADRLDRELARLRADILDETVSVGQLRSFRILDPKPRLIHAPCFRERVLHHALIEKIGPVLDRALVADTFACRVGKGTLAAVLRAREHMSRFPWFVKVDMASFFASIDHGVLEEQLARRLKGASVLRLCGRIIRAFETEPGKGLPIGALTSQHFANTYLSGLDRFLLEELRVVGMVRYMDHVVSWHAMRDRLAGPMRIWPRPGARERLKSLATRNVPGGTHSMERFLCQGLEALPGTSFLSRTRAKQARPGGTNEGSRGFLTPGAGGTAAGPHGKRRQTARGAGVRVGWWMPPRKLTGAFLSGAP